MTTKHTATLPDGTIAKRTSANRVYPFVIAVGPLTEAQIAADLEAEAVRSDEYAARYAETADYLEHGGELVVKPSMLLGFRTDYVIAPGLPFNGASDDTSAYRGIARLVRADESTGTGYIDIEAARAGVTMVMRRGVVDALERSARVRARKAAANAVRWHVAGWASRPELAAKTAESTRRLDPRREVRVLDTERS